MSLGMAAGQFTQGYLGQEDVEKRRNMAATQAQAEGEERKLRMDKFRSEMKKENFAEAAKRMLTGDLDGAVEYFNKSGDKKIAPGSVTVDKGEDGVPVFAWKDADTGEDVVMDSRFMMLTAGIKPTDLESIEGKRKHELDLAKARGKSSGTTAEIRNTEFILNNLTDDDGKQISKNKAWEMATSGKLSRERLAVRIRGQILADNAKNMVEMSPEEVNQKTLETMSFIEDNYGKKSKKKTGGMDGPSDAAPAGKSITQQLQEKLQRKAAITPGPDDDIEDDL